jgi:hypothetical protein
MTKIWNARNVCLDLLGVLLYDWTDPVVCGLIARALNMKIAENVLSIQENGKRYV